MKQKTLSLLATFLVAVVALAAVTDRYNHSVKQDIRDSAVRYYGTVAMGVDSTADHRTQAMWIGDWNGQTAYLYAKGALSTDSVAIVPEYSNDLRTWVAGTEIGKLDGTTALNDTFNVATGVPSLLWRTHGWLRIKFDGLASNRKNTTPAWTLSILNPQGVKTTKTPTVTNSL